MDHSTGGIPSVGAPRSLVPIRLEGISLPPRDSEQQERKYQTTKPDSASRSRIRPTPSALDSTREHGRDILIRVEVYSRSSSSNRDCRSESHSHICHEFEHYCPHRYYPTCREYLLTRQRNSLHVTLDRATYRDENPRDRLEGRFSTGLYRISLEGGTRP